jgi:hypothetical protein
MPTAPYDIRQRAEVFQGYDAAAGDRFGDSVAISGDAKVLAIGVPTWEGTTDQGTVMIYDWKSTADGLSLGGWYFRGFITAHDFAASDQLGTSVALNSDGTKLVAGAPLWEGPVTNVGGVYTYLWSSNTWNVTPAATVLQAGDAATYNFAALNFGSAVALSPDGLILAVGASGWSLNGSNLNRGKVYLYDWNSGTSSWQERAQSLFDDAPANSVFFGGSVAMSSGGNVLAVGAHNKTNGGINSGGVAIFDWNSGTSLYQLRGWVYPSDAASADAFGRGVALSSDGTILVVGADQWEGADNISSQGCIYVFEWTGSAWVQRAQYDPPDGADTDNFGNSVACSSAATSIAVGAPGWEQNTTVGISGAGGVYSLDYYRYRISGDVLDASGSAVARDLVAYNRATREHAGETTSAGDGTYTMGVRTSDDCFVVALDDAAGTVYNALILDKITPY